MTPPLKTGSLGRKITGPKPRGLESPRPMEHDRPSPLPEMEMGDDEDKSEEREGIFTPEYFDLDVDEEVRGWINLVKLQGLGAIFLLSRYEKEVDGSDATDIVVRTISLLVSFAITHWVVARYYFHSTDTGLNRSRP